MWDGRLQGAEAVVERQQGVPPEGDDDGFLLGRERGGVRVPRPGRQVGDRSPLAPFGDRLRVHAMATGQSPQALLTMLDRATDRLCRGGAPVKNLAHSASFHACEKTAPSNPEIKHPSRAGATLGQGDAGGARSACRSAARHSAATQRAVSACWRNSRTSGCGASCSCCPRVPSTKRKRCSARGDERPVRSLRKLPWCSVCW